MKLFIAEKPSMAKEIAKSLPKPYEEHISHGSIGFIQTGGGIVTWCFGHILRTFEPDEYDPKYKLWRLEHLPIVPEIWKDNVAEKCKAQFNVINGLLKDALKNDYKVVHAGDPDREGQLLIDEVLEYCGYKKKVLRLIVNALDEQSLKKSLANLRDNKEFASMCDSAKARQRADWLVGMNLTRNYTLRAQRAGHTGVFSVGRVQTPTLGLIVRREREIKNFKPVDYAIVKGEFAPRSNKSFVASWKAKEEQEGLDPEGRLIDKAALERLIGKLRGSSTATVISCETSPKQEAQPLPYSLSALQVKAGKKFGLSPQQVLDICQKLYESKLTTYPRSDCDYLPESQLADGSVIIGNLRMFNDTVGDWADGANVKHKSRAWSDKEITAHHAIIPTTVSAKENTLSEAERNIYILIAQAYIAQFYPVHRYNQTEVKINLVGEEFRTKGRVVTDEGFKVIYKKDSEEDSEGRKAKGEEEENRNLPPMQKGDVLDVRQIVPEWRETKPPTRFTEAMLIDAMKNIHKFVKGVEKKNRLKSTKGIGTEATRSTIIKDLIERGFMKVGAKKYLEPTEKGNLLIDVLPEVITLPDETAEWEDGLEAILKKIDGVTLESFVKGLAARLPELMVSARVEGQKASLEAKWPCECGGGFVKLSSKFKKGEFYFRCNNCGVMRRDKKGEPGDKIEKKENNEEVNKDFPCPECKEGFLQRKPTQKDLSKFWWGCNRFPKCRCMRFDEKGKPAKK